MDDRLRRTIMQIESGRFSEAFAAIASLLAEFPDNPRVLNGLGRALAQQRQYEPAMPMLLAAARNGRAPELWADLINMLRAECRWEELKRACLEARPIVGDHPMLLSVWGQAHLNTGQFETAIDLFERTLRHVPDQPLVLHNLSQALCLAGRHEEAVAAFARRIRPWDGEPSRRDFVTEYAAVAENYEDNASQRTFSAKLVEFFERVCGHRQLQSALDLGCGTGLVGAQMTVPPSRLVGIDMSGAMLSVAESKGIYARLIEGDIVTAMEELNELFDGVFSASALCYIPDLRPVFEQTARLLSTRGVFVLVVDPSPDDEDISVSAPGEFCHSRRYLRRLAVESGLSEIAMEIGIHRGPPGFWCAFRKN